VNLDTKATGTYRAKTKHASPTARWFVYLLRCSNGCLYTGIATDVQKRLAMHNAGKGSAYVRAHRPAVLVSFTACENRSVASIQEYAVKSLKKSQKLALAKTWKAETAPVRKPRKRKLAKVPLDGASLGRKNIRLELRPKVGILSSF
jgi:predicted GIY-YIG superfamily endonuclease